MKGLPKHLSCRKCGNEVVKISMETKLVSTDKDVDMVEKEIENAHPVGSKEGQETMLTTIFYIRPYKQAVLRTEKRIGNMGRVKVTEDFTERTAI